MNMLAQIQNDNNTDQVTMSSLEIVDFINEYRAKNESNPVQLRHDSFMAKVPKVLGENQSPKFIGDYKDAKGRTYPCYYFQKREACLMAMSYSIERLKAENKMLHEAAATHLKNQMHFKKLYDALVEQLYPYAIDLEEPVDGDVNITPQEFINGYNRARECAHYNLLEMMESDVEYIKAQCGMLGGGGEA